jgi:hypothetical protein
MAARSAAQFQGTANSFGREQCFILNHFPDGSGALYRQGDTKKEKELCGVPFEDKGIGLCPKTWSTSPGTIVYDIRESKYNGNPEAFESAFCPRQRALKDTVAGIDKLASFKQSINGQFHQSTSATYAQASALYYHFSRYLNAIVDVPVAVMRTLIENGRGECLRPREIAKQAIPSVVRAIQKRYRRITA